ncbi:radical SAM protein [candidate division WOR-3 bacterium]|nr:radical SAM protein [candidate division WOR-3 bacterium]
MLDKYNREISYLRVSVTDRCNLRCFYCMPEEGIEKKAHSDIISYENIVKIVRDSVRIGIKKIRLTGGEPLVRKGIEDLVTQISAIDGIEEVCMTTNGILLSKKAAALRKNGLDRVNISLDTLDPERYKAVTRGGDIKAVLQGIESAIEENLSVKINMVVLKDTGEGEIMKMKKFCSRLEISLQLINAYTLDSVKTESPFDRPPKCENCNRIRLMSDGKLKPCLHNDIEITVDYKDIYNSLVKTVLSKPERGCVCRNRKMNEIGG